MTDEPKFASLIAKYVLNTLSKQEKEELLAWMVQSEDHLKFVLRYQQQDLVGDANTALKMDKASIQRKYRSLLEDAHKSSDTGKVAAARRAKMEKRVLLATMLLAIISAFIWPYKDTDPLSLAALKIPSPARSGKMMEQATLMLLDGKTVNFDSIPVGTAIDMDGWRITRQQERYIVYGTSPAGTGAYIPKDTDYHTFSIPYGVSWQLSLPGGAKVWLNAGSTLSYPVHSAIRQPLLLQGEALFDIASNPQRPTMVLTKKGRVRVLGTRFDIRNYDKDDAFSATVVRGTVIVGDDNNCQQISSGILAKIDSTTDRVQVKDVDDMERTLSWTTPYFNFSGRTIAQVMGEIIQWYGMEGVTYRGKIDTLHLGLLVGGHTRKDLPLPDLLQHLGSNRPLFSIEGKKIIVNAGYQ